MDTTRQRRANRRRAEVMTGTGSGRLAVVRGLVLHLEARKDCTCDRTKPLDILISTLACHYQHVLFHSWQRLSRLHNEGHALLVAM